VGLRAEQAACGAGERGLELPPGDFAAPDELRMRIPVRDVVGKAQFTVNYYFRAMVRLNGDSTESRHHVGVHARHLQVGRGARQAEQHVRQTVRCTLNGPWVCYQ
jgi:hypothetical protein